MSAADRMPIRTPNGVRSVPRRLALGLISAGRAKPTARRPDEPASSAGVASRGVNRATSTHEPVTPELAQTVAAHAQHIDTQFREDGSTAIEVTITDPEGVRAVADLIDLPDQGAASERLDEPRGNASRLTWEQYAVSVGVVVTDDMTRNQIRDAARKAAQSDARLPQPAHEGGRLETPEDEPVTESAVTDGENPGQE